LRAVRKQVRIQERRKGLPYLIGFAGLFLIWVVLGLASRFTLSALVAVEDGRPSMSKLQLVAWTAVMVFSYLAIYCVRVRMDISQRFFLSLDVVCQEVVVIETCSADGRLLVEAGVRPVPVVLVGPGWE
jgi:hypothetical protein